MPLDKLFATPVFHVDLPEIAQELIKFQFNVARSNIESDLSETTWGDNISTTFKAGENDAIGKYELGGLLEFVNPVVKYFNDLLYADSNIAMYDSWINYQGKHQHQRQHTHPGGRISVVYYVQSNGQDGNLTFHPPVANMDQIEPSCDEWNYSMISYPPVQGRMFVFPSWVPHSVGDNMTDDTRISIAMNFK